MHVSLGVVNFRVHKSVRPSADHIPRVCAIHTLTFAHSTNPRTSTLPPHDNNDPFDLTHCPLPILRCALHLVPPTDTLPIPIAPLLVPILILVLRFCGHRAQCFQPLTSFVLLFIVRHSHLSLNTFDQHFTLTVSVFICSIICLAIAAHFQSVLSASDLSKSCMHG
jgi:hypothetical protein